MNSFVYKRAVSVCALSAVLITSGCSFAGSGTDANAEKSALKVMFYDERSFYDQFGMLYSALHPNVDLTVANYSKVYSGEPVKDPEAAFNTFIEEEQPDILMLSPDQITRYASDGKLVELDMMTEDKSYNKDTLIPGLLDYMRELGDGKIYGLSSNFSSQVIYYNKDLFEEYGIPLPEDKMSWEKVFELSRRFPTDGPKDKRVYGLSLSYNNDVYNVGNLIGNAQNLNMYNASTKQVTINTDAWKKVFQTAIDGLKSGAFYTEDQNAGVSGPASYEDYLMRDPFISGRLAMKLDYAYQMNQIKEAQTRLKDKGIKNWDMVTMPVDPQNPDSSPYMSFGQIFAINSKSVNIDAAKDFIRYITSEDFARVSTKRDNGNFPVRSQYVGNDTEHNMKAFYSLKPVVSASNKDMATLPMNFYGQFMSMAQEELKGVFDGKKSIDQALELLQTKGQQLLNDEVEKEKNNPPVSEGFSSTSSDVVSVTTSH